VAEDAVAAADDEDELMTPAPSPSAAQHAPDSPDETADDAAVTRRWLRRSDLAPLRDRADFGPLIVGFFVRVQQAAKAGLPAVHALLQVRSVRYRSRAYELLTARAARGGRPEYAFQELVLEDDSVVTLNSVSNRPLAAPEVQALQARVAAGALRWPCGSRAARSSLEAAAAALIAEKEARVAARLDAKAAEAVAAATAPAPAANVHPDTGIDEYGGMDVGAVLSNLNDAPLLSPAAVASAETRAPLSQPSSQQPAAAPKQEVVAATRPRAPTPDPPPLPPPPPLPEAPPGPVPPWVRRSPPAVQAGRVSRWEAAPAAVARDRTASPDGPPARVDPYAGTELGLAVHGRGRHSRPPADAAPQREWRRRSRERSRSRSRWRSRSPGRRRSPSPRWQPSRSRSRSPTRHAGRGKRQRSRDRANGLLDAGRFEPKTWAQKQKYPSYDHGKIYKPNWRDPSPETLARDAAIKAQRATGEAIDPSLVLLKVSERPAGASSESDAAEGDAAGDVAAEPSEP
jgi:hypothetical protein